ncbi:class I SAM-dependent methyltransferase [Nakamurella alba]|nr:rRNA adenine N-6-methyltransferase family protein [Nakamurella alba]
MSDQLDRPDAQTTTRTRPGGRPRRTGMFVREFLRSPLTTASLVPSSPALAAAMIARRADGRAPEVVVELGPGTGAFTTALQAIRPARHVAIELNPTLAAGLAADFPDVEVVTAAAADLRDVLAGRGLSGAVDLVVSGLPWQAFAGDAGHDLIGDVAGALRPDGAYTQFTYSWTRWAPPGRRQLGMLAQQFRAIAVDGPIWRNFPAATVYTCRGPIAPPAG